MADRPRRTAGIAAGSLLLIAAAVWVAVTRSARPPDGPVAVVWDATRCARCGMLVSEPGFAAQRHLADGRVLHYDDPGCLLADEPPRGSEEHAAWVHHLHEDRWIPLERAAFVRVPHSPMGFGLGAIAGPGAETSLDPTAARAWVRGRAGVAP